MSKTVIGMRGEYKCKVSKMHLKLRDQQHIYIAIQKPMVIAK